jgi:type I restriction enzyme S subunit
MRDGEKYRLGDLCKIVKGETPIKQAIPGRYPLVVTAAERASHETFQFDCRAVIVPLVSSTGHGHASIKRINYQEGKFALGSILCAVIPKDEKRLNAKFLHVYFSYFKDQLIVPLMKGSANVSLSIGTLADLKIIVPPMDVQLRVISLAENDALMKPLEHEIAHQQSLLAKLKQAILQEAIQGKLTADWRAAHSDVEPASQLLHRIQAEKARLIAAKTLRPEKPLPKITPAEIPFEIPKGWEWCRLLAVSNEIHYGFTASADPAHKETRLLRITDIQDDRVDWESVPGCRCSAKERVKYLLGKGDILIARTGGTVGKSFLVDSVPVQSVFASYLVRVVPSSLELATFVKLYLGSPCYWSQLVDAARGAQPNVSGSKLKLLLLPLPPLAEQAAIVERVEALMTTCRALEAEIEHARTHAAHLLQAVLKEAFAPAN